MTRMITGRIAAKTLALLAVCTTLFSFSSLRGGHSFRILLNDKMLVEAYVGAKEGTKTFDLSKASTNDQLSIYYNECGKIGTGRSIAIRDENNRTLKEWHYADATASKTGMSCKVKDILALQKDKNTKLQLYYSSKIMSDGQLLAAITTVDQRTAIK